MDIEKIKKGFPMFAEHSDLVYLDTAATSLTPEPVLAAMDSYYRTYRANVHRGLYAEAERASMEYEGARKKVAKFIGADSTEVVFTANATTASNMLIYMLEQSLDLREGDEIVTTSMEHHAMLLPLQQLAKRKGLVLKYAQLTKDFALDIEDLHELITDKTRIVAVTAASNVTGTIVEIPTTSLRRRSDVVNDVINDVEGPVIIRDATALVGHMPVDVKELGADFVFFSGHKMCGPTGVGVLYGKKEWLEKLEPGFFGGGIVDDVTAEGAEWSASPERFEAGTQNVAGVIGLGSAVEYLTALDLREVRAHCQELVAYMQEQLSTIEGVTLYAAAPEHNVGIVSFTVEGLSRNMRDVHPHDMAQIAADNHVAVRAGHHCALPLIRELGVAATVRTSVYLYNTKEDVDVLVATIKKARSIFSQNSKLKTHSSFHG